MGHQLKRIGVVLLGLAAMILGGISLNHILSFHPAEELVEFSMILFMIMGLLTSLAAAFAWPKDEPSRWSVPEQ